MGILGLIPFVVELVKKILPGKTTNEVSNIVNAVIGDDKELQEFVEKQNRFTLEFEGRAEFLSKAVGVIRALPRPFIAIAIMVILFKYLWFNLIVPDKLWYLSTGIFSFYFYLRHLEKKNNLK
jgi:hypothetical protein